MVDLDKRDIEIELWLDDINRGHRPIALDNTVDCGQDIRKCLDLGFASEVLLIPPGEHTFRAEIHKRKCSKGRTSSCSIHIGTDESFEWGEEKERRVAWMIEECHS
jgi:hypothetical protein